jgi:dTDP-glucose 4,6-dehydratase
MTRVAVIGSNSFSGSDFIAHLLEEGGYEVLGISRRSEKSSLFLPYKRLDTSQFTFRQHDLNSDLPGLLQSLDAFAPEYVVNFAAQSEVAPSWLYPAQWYQTNAVAITALADELRKRSWLKRYVHISSPEVYGSCKGRVTEEAPFSPSTPYAASKAAGDLSLTTFAKQYDFPLVLIRATNVYGAHQQLFKIIPRSAIYLRQGRAIELHGGGKAVKSYIHIRDVSRGERLAMEQGESGEVYHFSPDNGIAVCDVVEKMCSLLGCDFAASTRIVDERPGQDAAYVIDSSKARSRFGWKPEITLDEGLRQVVEWVEGRWPEIEAETLEYAHIP